MLENIMSGRGRRFFYVVLAVFVFLYCAVTGAHLKVSVLEKRSLDDGSPDGNHQQQVNAELPYYNEKIVNRL
jgi:hypothetical protein